jgi:hypothetical protein
MFGSSHARSGFLALCGARNDSGNFPPPSASVRLQPRDERIVHVVEHRQRLLNTLTRALIAGAHHFIGERNGDRFLIDFVAPVMHDDIALKAAKRLVAEVLDPLDLPLQIFAFHAMMLSRVLCHYGVMYVPP